MEIRIKKIRQNLAQYHILREDGTRETFDLDTRIYLLHDLTHFVVEKTMDLKKGFWGMLSEGYAFHQLFGKENPLTADLRVIETIVGPVQSLAQGFIDIKDLPVYLSHTEIDTEAIRADEMADRILRILKDWEELEPGQELILQF